MEKDRGLRLLFLENELQYRFSKSIFVNRYLPTRIRLIGYNDIIIVGKCRSRISNYCVVTGKSRGILKGFNFSRSWFKFKVKVGDIGGIRCKFFC